MALSGELVAHLGDGVADLEIRWLIGGATDFCSAVLGLNPGFSPLTADCRVARWIVIWNGTLS